MQDTHGVSRARGTCATSANSSDIGVKIAHSTSGQHNKDNPTHPDKAPNVNSAVLNDKYFIETTFPEWGSGEIQDIDIFLEQVHFFEKTENCDNFHGVKGRLKAHANFWESIGASEFVLNTIKEGYIIPFLENPTRMSLRNNKSAFVNHKFVDQAVSELVNLGCARQVPFEPFVVNPLSVSINKSGKARLILDLSILNKCVRKDKFKFEDWKIAVQFFSKENYMFKFDLKSGYHHFDICVQQQTFLGFSWKNKFYCFTVLPFGLSTAPYIFSKCLRTLVKYWRRNSINIVLYLDDGFGMTQNFDDCKTDAKFVKESLQFAGFLINEEKSVFDPVQELEWLGIVWNSKDFYLNIPDRRVNDLAALHNALDNFCTLSARKLAQVTGRIISMSPVVGNITRLMTRYCYMCIENRVSWDSLLHITFPVQVRDELSFWLENLQRINCKKLDFYSKSNVVVYSDASGIACGAYTVEFESKVFHKMWDQFEIDKSSTWREMKAIEQALLSFMNVFKGKTLKWFTDNQNCVRIIKSGSMKLELNVLARSIFSVCSRQGISIDIQWIPRSDNEKADYISKMIDHEDWGVTVEFFNYIDALWGPHTIDRFANCNNAKIARFNSLFWTVGCEAVDAFSQNWCNENNWLVPPIYSVLRVLKHMLACKASGTLIVPRWVSAPFWPYIFKKDLIYQDYVTDVLEFKNPERIYVQGSNKNSIFGSDHFYSPVLAVRIRV